jgi:hypothetical protein
MPRFSRIPWHAFRYIQSLLHDWQGHRSCLQRPGVPGSPLEACMKIRCFLVQHQFTAQTQVTLPPEPHLPQCWGVYIRISMFMYYLMYYLATVYITTEEVGVQSTKERRYLSYCNGCSWCESISLSVFTMVEVLVENWQSLLHSQWVFVCCNGSENTCTIP